MATINEFLLAVKSDDALNQKFLELCGERPETEEAMAQAQAKAAAELGYDVPVEEFRLTIIKNDELSDEDLEAAAGGNDVSDIWIDVLKTAKDVAGNLYDKVVDHICWENNLCVAWHN